jgi:hypothetical protein
MNNSLRILKDESFAFLAKNNHNHESENLITHTIRKRYNTIINTAYVHFKIIIILLL